MSRAELIELAEDIRTKSSEHEDYDPDLEVTCDAQNLAVAVLEHFNVIDDDGKPAEPEHYCRECGGTNVEHAMWVSLNENEINGEYGTWNYGDNAYCGDCEEHGSIISRNDVSFMLWAQQRGIIPPPIEDYSKFIGQATVLEVLTEACAQDLDSDVGEQLVIVDSKFEDPTKPNAVTYHRYWTGRAFMRTDTEAFVTWLKRGGLKLVQPDPTKED